MIDIYEVENSIKCNAYFYRLGKEYQSGFFFDEEQWHDCAWSYAKNLDKNLLSDLSMFDPQRVGPKPLKGWLQMMSTYAQSGRTKFPPLYYSRLSEDWREYNETRI